MHKDTANKVGGKKNSDTKHSSSNIRNDSKFTHKTSAVAGRFTTQEAARSYTKKAGNFFRGHVTNADLHTVTAGEKIKMIREGVSKKDLVEIKDDAELDYDTLSTMLSVSRATLINKKSTAKFDQPTSEKILLFADVMAYGKDVFEDKDNFNRWLKKSNKALGDQTPIAMMDTIYGIQEVKNELGRIEYGTF